MSSKLVIFNKALLACGQSGLLTSDTGATPQHAALNRTQREYMARAPQARRLRSRVDDGLYGLAALKGRNTCLRVKRIYGNRKGRLMIIRVIFDHLANAQFLQALALDRHADEPLGIGGHEIDLLRCHRLRRNNDIAFIFSIFIIYNHQHFSLADIFNCIFYFGKSHNQNPFSPDGLKTVFC